MPQAHAKSEDDDLPSSSLHHSEALQRAYYSRTAPGYDELHADDDGDHNQYIPTLLGSFARHDIQTVLDVGCGTAVRTARIAASGHDVTGVEPVVELLQQRGIPLEARERIGQGYLRLQTGSTYELPFENESFDAVMEMGMLHHVKRPEVAVAEMLRVARRMVIISDANRFGQGPVIARLAKFALFSCGLWPAVEFLRTRGKGFHYSEGDGVFYSYSAIDSLPTIARWASTVDVLSMQSARGLSILHPLLTSSHLLVMAFRDLSEPG